MKTLSSGSMEKLSQSGKITVIDFYATWCGPCKKTMKSLEELESEMTDIEFWSCNVETEEDIASKFGIRNLPTVIVMKDGKRVGSITGGLPKDVLMENLKSVIREF